MINKIDMFNHFYYGQIFNKDYSVLCSNHLSSKTKIFIYLAREIYNDDFYHTFIIKNSTSFHISSVMNNEIKMGI